MYDLIVIGGGPGGSSCARRAALAGLDVLLLESDIHPRRKLCGGLVNPNVKQLLDFDLSGAVERTIHAAKVIHSSGQHFSVSRDDINGLMVKREVFDKLLFDQAKEAGVEVNEGQKAITIEQVQSGVRVLVKGDSFKSRALVGADGVNSIVARDLGIRKRWNPKHVALCIAADAPVTAREIENSMSLEGSPGSLTIEVYLGLQRWCYAWCFPRQNELSLGIGARMDFAHDLKRHWKQFLSSLESEKGLKLDTSNWSAWRVPMGDPLARKTTRRTILVGDAAGFASSITGEGIYFAIKSGLTAADVVVEMVKSQDPMHIYAYEERIAAEIGEDLRVARSIAEILHKAPRNMELVMEIAREDPVIQQLVIDMVMNQKPYSKLKRSIIKRLVLKHPLKAMRLSRA